MWQPENAQMVTIDIDVDIHVPAMYLDMFYTVLMQSGMEHEYVTGQWYKRNTPNTDLSFIEHVSDDAPSFRVLIEDLQSAVTAEASQPRPRAHSYTKYNTMDEVSGLQRQFLSRLYCCFLLFSSLLLWISDRILDQLHCLLQPKPDQQAVHWKDLWGTHHDSSQGISALRIGDFTVHTRWTRYLLFAFVLVSLNNPRSVRILAPPSPPSSWIVASTLGSGSLLLSASGLSRM